MSLEELVLPPGGDTVHLYVHDLAVQTLVVVIIAHQLEELKLVFGSGQTLVHIMECVHLNTLVLDVHFAIASLTLLGCCQLHN